MTTKKPAKIKASRRIRTMGLASLLRNGSARPLAKGERVQFHEVGGIERSVAAYWRNAGQEG